MSAPWIPLEVDLQHISPEWAEQDAPVLGHGRRNEREVPPASQRAPMSCPTRFRRGPMPGQKSWKAVRSNASVQLVNGFTGFWNSPWMT
jgi:hypothetical protein